MIVFVVICDECGVVSRVVDLHYCDIVLQRVLEMFICEWVCDASSPNVVLQDDGLC